jgi:hypothetical protein
VLHIHWQEQQLEVDRLVFRRGHRGSYEAILSGLATRLRVAIADDSAEPRPGDFWLGCLPRAGWGDTDPSLIGWASAVEVPLAAGLLGLTASNSIE